MKDNNIKEILTALVNASNKMLVLEQTLIDDWSSLIDNKKMTSDEANKIYGELVENVGKESHKLYEQYYNIIHSLVDNKRIDEIQEKINYNFMSLDFINELVKEL